MAKLSPKAKLKWALNYILIVLVILIISYFGATIIEELLSLKEGILFNSVLLLSILILIPYLLYIEVKYRRFRYSLGDKEIMIKKGIINISEVVVPYERIQNINSEIDLVSNILGIATIKIETAGSKVDESEIELPGIENPQEFMSFIMSKVEKIREKPEKVVENKQKIELISEEIKSIKDMVSSISQRFVLFEGELNSINDKLNRLEKLNSMFSSRIGIVEQSQNQLNQRMDDIVDNTNKEMDEIREMLKKAVEKRLKANKEKVKKSKTKKK